MSEIRRTQNTADNTVDPITLSVVHHRLQAINREMGVVMLRTSRSPIFAEVHDFSCAICDWRSRIVSQVDGVPSHTASSMLAAKACVEAFAGDMKPGDVFLVNDPYGGGTHLADVTIVKPCYIGGELLFLAINRAHHGDVGGLSPGSYSPLATEIYHEGIRIPPVRIYSGGEPIEDVINVLAINTRDPETLKSDLKAQVASCVVAQTRLEEMVEHYGSEECKRIVDSLQEHAERRMRQEITKLPDGEYTAEVFLDDDGFDARQVGIKVTLRVEGDEIEVDFEGTHPQTKGFINSPMGNSATSVYVGILTVLGKDIPRIEGAYKPIKIKAPKGCVIDAQPPAAVASCTLDTACAILEVVWLALSKAVPDRAPAAWNRLCGAAISGIDPRKNEFFVDFTFSGLGGAGAVPGIDGLPYMADGIDLGGLTAPNVESNELSFPQLTECHEFLTDSGGAGRWRGGVGVRFKIRMTADDCTLVMHGDGCENPPFGLHGGKPGRTNLAILNEDTEEAEKLPSKCVRSIGLGDTYTLYASGGGGWGSPLERPPSVVREDVIDGFVSREKAKSDYGVVLTYDLQIDEPATQRERECRGQEETVK